LASSLTLFAALLGAWMGLGPSGPGDYSAMSVGDQTAGLARAELSDRGSRGGGRDGADLEAGRSTRTDPVSDRAEKPERTPSTPLPVPRRGSGKTRIAFGGTPAFGEGPLIRYRVEVERELPFDPDEVAQVVDATLRDERSWAAHGKATFQRVSDGSADLRIIVATPATTDRLCYPLDTGGKVSCRNQDVVALNADRWNVGVKAYDDITAYRHYLVNHEVGHFLGHDHTDCAGPGKKAPVMMQQTKGVGECRPNPWPLPSEF